MGPLVLVALLVVVLLVALLVAGYRAFGRRKQQAPASAVPSAPAAPLAAAVPAAPPPAYAPPAARHTPAPPHDAGAALGAAYLTVAGVAQHYPLHADVCVIGREPGCEVELPAHLHFVSRRHAQIERSGDDYILSDLGSTNGVWVNQARVERNLLRDGMVFSLGHDDQRVDFTFFRNA